MNVDTRYFFKQFLIAENGLNANVDHIPKLAHWLKHRFSERIDIICHPLLCISKAKGGHGELLCLGDIVDPLNPDADNDGVMHALADSTHDFESLERHLARMAGRWVILAEYDHSAYLYHDAGGLKSVFIYNDGDTCCVASQPSLLAQVLGLKRCDQRAADIERARFASWPIYTYPYDSVTQLLPNHRLNLNSHAIERYWPKRQTSPSSLDDAASEITFYIKRIVQAALARKHCHIPLTGGHDSRLLLACTQEFRDTITYFTIRTHATPRHDLVIPAKIARICGVRHQTHDARECEPEVLRVLEANSSHMFFQRGRENVCTQAAIVRDGFNLTGTLAEQLRCLYYPTGLHPDVTPAELCRRAGYGENPTALSGLEKWWSNYPDTDILPLDLLYWEHKIGVWLSASIAYREALVDIFPPINCRHILELGLSVDVAYRRRPHELFRRIYAAANPRLLKVPINTTHRQLMFKNARRIMSLSRWRAPAR